MFNRFFQALFVHVGGLILGALLIGTPAVIAQTATPATTAQATTPGAFWDALILDDVDGVRRFLLRGLSSNSVHPDKGPAIVLAVQQKAFKSMRVLLESPLTDVNTRNDAGESALMLAALHGDLETARLLVKRGALVNMPGWTPLHYAAIGGDLATVTWLLEQHAYVDSPSANGTTPLMMAAREGKTTVARYLVAQGADPSLRNQSGLGAPEYFLRSGETEQARWMADRATEYLRKYGTQAEPVPAANPPGR